MTGTRISFVLASYNGAAYIEAQLASILAALSPDDEIIVSDDGSTDATCAVVAAIADPRIQLLQTGPRLGYQKNFERAITATRGRFIFFSDQDDICLPARVPQSLAALSRVGCVCGDAIVVDQNLAHIAPSYFAARKAKFSAAMLFLRPAVIGATMACRRDFLDASLPFPDAVPHDMWLSVRAARQRELMVIGEPFILYRRHPTAVSVTGTARRRALLVRLIERLRLARALLQNTATASASGPDELFGRSRE